MLGFSLLRPLLKVFVGGSGQHCLWSSELIPEPASVVLEGLSTFPDLASSYCTCNISENVVFQFLSFHFHEKSFKPPTTAVYYRATWDPLAYSFQHPPDSYFVDLIWKRYFHQSPTRYSIHPFCSFQKVLDHLSSSNFLSSVLTEKEIQKAEFLVALASELRVLETLSHNMRHG